MPGRLPYLLICALYAHLSALAADPPEYLTEALSRFNPNLPADFAYTVTTTRGHETSVERYDPSTPPESQWTLLQLNKRAPTSEERSRHSSYRIATSRSTHQTFLRSDIDSASLQLIREDAERAEYSARFREGVDDPLLAKLTLRLTVVKSPATVERFILELNEPHSPVLTVKMLALTVETSLAPPAPGQPPLPAHITSRFRGRVFFFKNIEEDVDSTYTNFTKVSLPATASAPTAR